MVTYHRRYALVSALGMAAGDDDDGASAKASQTAPKAQERPQTPPPGKPVAQVKGQLVKFLEGKVPSGTEKDHAAQVWTDDRLVVDNHTRSFFAGEHELAPAQPGVDIILEELHP